MPINWDSKKPGATETYDLDWSAYLLPGDKITNSVWAIVGGATSLTITPVGNTDTVTQLKTSGGTNNQSYVLRNTITTLLGETYPQEVVLPIKDN